MCAISNGYVTKICICPLPAAALKVVFEELQQVEGRS